MASLPRALQLLIEELAKLPGVGPRTAERYALALLRAEPALAGSLSAALGGLHEGVGYCQHTFALVEPGQSVSNLYSDPARNRRLVAVVEDPLDVMSIEKTGEFRGTYHVLGGLLSPIDGVGPEKLRLRELFARLEADEVEELILATNSSVEGESTALYIQKQLEGQPIRLSRLARGIPVGVDLEYTDQLTLSRALEHRQAM
jgi:recombination protein RecR